MSYQKSKVATNISQITTELEYHLQASERTVSQVPTVGIIYSNNCIELSLFESGDYSTSVINGITYQMFPGYVSVTSPLDVSQNIMNGRHRYYYIAFYETVLSKEVLTLWSSRRGPICGKLPAEAFERVLRNTAFALEEYHGNAPGKDSMIKSLINIILLDILRNVGTLPTNDPTDEEETFYRITRYIKEHFREKITLESLSGIFHLSPAYLCRFFHQKNGTSLRYYLQNLRLEYAANLLRSSDLSIYDICLDSGFMSAPHFTKVFREKYGVTPSQMRKRTPIPCPIISAE